MTQDLSGYTRQYFEMEKPEYWFPRYGLPRPDMLAAICYAFNVPFRLGDVHGGRREPGVIMSVGSGPGWLEEWLERMGCEVIGVDPSPGVKALYRGKFLQDDWSGIEACRTIIFCESLEHIPLDQVRQMWQEILANSPCGTRVIVVNWPDFWPIEPSGGWDHITRLHDGLYDELSEGFDVIVRWGSHLVLEKPS